MVIKILYKIALNGHETALITIYLLGTIFQMPMKKIWTQHLE